MATRNRLQLSRRRRRSRGAAMVEALAAVPFFIIIFASMLYVGRLYGEKQRTLRQAKEYAWTYAMRNCTGSAQNVGTEGNGGPGIDLGEANNYKGVGGDKSLSKDFGTSVATVQGKVTASKIIGGKTNNLSTTTRVQCNEEPVDGDLIGVLRFAWKALTSW
ncbi:MAG: hypothetical protein HY898_33935 [Deltaproteobacteria bacterium]|nr:hypothetical protein [Deltaproteobacteria bacterium]